MNERLVVLVCGPPCSGKSTYVQANAQPGDLVVDYDRIAQDLGSPRSHGHDYKYHRTVEQTIERMLSDIEAGRTPRAWVIRALPKQADRDRLALRLNADRVVVLNPPAQELRRRAMARPNPRKTLEAIAYWRRASRSRISPHA